MTRVDVPYSSLTETFKLTQSLFYNGRTALYLHYLIDFWWLGRGQPSLSAFGNWQYKLYLDCSNKRYFIFCSPLMNEQVTLLWCCFFTKFFNLLFFQNNILFSFVFCKCTYQMVHPTEYIKLKPLQGVIQNK